ncbi:MAG: hypothetical protein LKJ86_04075 [Oscillibacter sp.]|jgi:hypothetical protein|nr:hypothetical protein [Oscillibacter sp.]
MDSDHEKNAYDALLNDAKKLTEGVEASDQADFSLEEILAEYGGSRRQKILNDVEQEAVGEAPSPEVPVSLMPEKTPPAQPKPKRKEKPPVEEEPPEDEIDDLPEIPPQVAKRSPEAAALEQEAQRRARAKLLAQPPIPEELPRAPRPVSMEKVVGRTVNAVMEEQELLPEKKRRTRGLFSRKEYVETEELYQRPDKAPANDSEPPTEPEPPEEPEPIGPEEPLEEMAADCRAEAKRANRPVMVSLLLTVLLTAVSVLDEQGIAIPGWTGDLKIQAIVQLAVLVAVAILCRGVFTRGVRMLAHRRCTGELLIAVSAVVTAADCATAPVFAARTAGGAYAIAACAALSIAQWALFREARGSFDAYRTAALTDEPPYLVTDVPQGACKQPGHIEGFYTDTVRPDLPLQWQTALLPVILAATVVFAGLSSLGQGRGQDFLHCWSAILAAAASIAMPLCWALPWSRLARALQKDGCSVAGWAGAEAIARRKTIILTDGDLFPPGTVKLNGLKVYGEVLPHAASYAASMIRESGCGLARLFDELVRSEQGTYYEVSDFSFYEEGGWSGTIHGESVLLGTASFMRKMDVRLPGNLNLHTGIYLAVEHQLSAVFAVKYAAAENVDWALHVLRRNHVMPILASRDPNLTPTLLKRKFNKKVKVGYPPLAGRLALSEQKEGRGMPHALLLREGLMPYAEVVAGSRRLVKAARSSTIVAMLGSAAGTLLAFYLAFDGSFALMTPVTMLAFLLLWTVPVFLLSSWSGRF